MEHRRLSNPLIPANAGTQIVRRSRRTVIREMSSMPGQLKSGSNPRLALFDLGPGIRRDERGWGNFRAQKADAEGRPS